jgi:hypothetical protein
VFTGSFDLDAVAAVTGAPAGAWDIDTLAALMSKSMIVPEQIHGAEARYRLLETLRQYALERLRQRGELDLVQRRHAQHFAAFAQQAGTALLGHDELAWRPRLLAEQDNLRAAVQWALGSDSLEDGESALIIAASLASYATFDTSGGIASLVVQAVERAQTSSQEQRTVILGAAAFYAFQVRGDVQLSEQLARDALRDGVTPKTPAGIRRLDPEPDLYRPAAGSTGHPARSAAGHRAGWGKRSPTRMDAANLGGSTPHHGGYRRCAAER